MKSKSSAKRIAASALTIGACTLALPVADANAQGADTSSVASADKTVKSTPHVQLGARFGYGVGAGSVYEGFSVSKGSYGFVPVIIDLGARITPHLYIGAYGGYGRVIPRTNSVSCPEGFGCGVDQYRFGVQVDWHFAPSTWWDPYIGLNSGYEILDSTVTGGRPVPTPAGTTTGDVNATVTERGWEYLGVILGSEIRSSRLFGLGPFFSGSVGSYSSRSGSTRVSVQGNTVSETSPAAVNQATHALFMLGLRGSFNL